MTATVRSFVSLNEEERATRPSTKAQAAAVRTNNKKKLEVRAQMAAPAEPKRRDYDESLFDEGVRTRASAIRVVKRNGTPTNFNLRKLYVRCESARNPHFSIVKNMQPAPELRSVDIVQLVTEIVKGAPLSIESAKLDDYIARMCMWKNAEHPDYNVLGGRIKISSMEKRVPESILEVVRSSAKGSTISRRKVQILMPWYVEFVERYHERLTDMMDFARDYVTGIGYQRRNSFGLMAYDGLEKAFLKLDGHSIERPQHLYMRVAVAQCRADIERHLRGEEVHLERLFDRVREKYWLQSSLAYTHASPTLYNSGTRGGLASCFLFEVTDSLTEGTSNSETEESNKIRVNGKSIYGTLQETAEASKGAGGLATSMSRLRSQGTLIAGTNGICNGLAPVLKIYDESSRYVDQGGNKRPGSNAIYLNTLHPECRDFVSCRSNVDTTSNKMRVNSLFPALWVEDVVMESFVSGKKVHQLDPSEYPGLCDTYGKDFDVLYRNYVVEAKERLRHAKANPNMIPLGTTAEKFVGYHVERSADFLDDILEMFQGCGLPYVAFKDHANHRNNMIDLDDPTDEIIQSFNLCIEVAQKPSTICNLSSIDVSYFANQEDGTYDYKGLYETVRAVVRNLNDVIDATEYKVASTRITNLAYRPMGVGIQGLANAFVKLGLPFDSDEALEVDANIAETMYFAALSESCDLAEKVGPYPKYKGSPASKGLLQQDLFENHWKYMTERIDGLFETMKKRSTNLSAKIEAIDRVLPCVEFLAKALPSGEAKKSRASGETAKETVRRTGCDVGAILRETANGDLADYFENAILPLAVGDPSRQDYPSVQAVSERITLIPQDESTRKKMADVLLTFASAVHKRQQELREDLDSLTINQAVFRELVDMRNQCAGTTKPSGLWNWDPLRAKIAVDGLRNCMMIAHMPTASTSIVLNKTDSFEPFRSMCYTRTMNNGSYVCVADQLVEKLVERGIWNPKMSADIRNAKGFLSRVEGMPKDLVDLFATSFEIPISKQILHAFRRSPHVDQSMSFNWHTFKTATGDPNESSPELKKTDMKRLIYAWIMGLKTAKYYNRLNLDFTGYNTTAMMDSTPSLASSTETSSSSSPQTVREEPAPQALQTELFVCTMQEGCVMCSG